MKLRIKTDKIELEVEQEFCNEERLYYIDAPNNFIKIIKEVINECSTKTKELIDHENK